MHQRDSQRGFSGKLRIKIIQNPRLSCIDGVRLDHFAPGFLYEVGNTLGAYLVAEGWAVPIDDWQPALLTPLAEFDADADEWLPPNLRREIYPPYYDGPPPLAHDRRHRRRRST